MQIDIEHAAHLRFDDGGPVRGASALAPFGSGWLIAQDDSTHACWWTGATATRVRAHPSIDGLDLFSEADGSKHLKPDFEAACAVDHRGTPAVLLLGSGSTSRRMRSALVRLEDGVPGTLTADLTGLYEVVARELGCSPGTLNLEGACVVGEALRWFQRGLPSAGSPTGSVDLDLEAVLAAAEGRLAPGEVPVGDARHYDLGAVDGVGLAVTEGVSLGDGRVLVSAAAEDSPDTYDDGPVVGSALAVLAGDQVLDRALLPPVDGAVAKVEGLGLLDWDGRRGRVLASVDDDDHTAPSALLTLRVRL